ncbi:MAG: 50S ribosomal protein L30 [Mycoplasmatales bacterium]
MSSLKVTLVRGLAGKRKDQIEVAKSLGLTKTNQSKVHPNNEATKGKVKKISHLVRAEEV